MLSIIPPLYSPPPNSSFVDNEKGTHSSELPAPNEDLRRAVCACCGTRSLVSELDFTGEKASCMDQFMALMACDPQGLDGSTYEKYFKPLNIRPRALVLTYIAATLWLSIYLLIPAEGPVLQLVTETTSQPTWYPSICKLQIAGQMIPRCGNANISTSNANIYNRWSYQQLPMSNNHHNSAPTVKADDSPIASSHIVDGPQATAKTNTPAMRPLRPNLIKYMPLHIFIQWAMSILGLFLWNRRESMFVVCSAFLLVIPLWTIALRIISW